MTAYTQLAQRSVADADHGSSITRKGTRKLAEPFVEIINEIEHSVPLARNLGERVAEGAEQGMMCRCGAVHHSRH